MDDIDLLSEKSSSNVNECVEKVCPKVDQIKKKKQGKISLDKKN